MRRTRAAFQLSVRRERVTLTLPAKWRESLRHLADTEGTPMSVVAEPLTASKLLGFKESSGADIHRKILIGFP